MTIKKGKLTLADKMAIKGGLGDGTPVKSIAKAINRSESTVQGYIDGELDALASTIAKARLDTYANGNEIDDGHDEPQPITKVRPLHEPPKHRRSVPSEDDLAEARPQQRPQPVQVASQEVIKAVYHDLCRAGLTNTDVNNIIQSAIEFARARGHRYEKREQFYTACIKRMNSGHFMIKKSQGGREGMAIMTPAASQRAEDHNNKRPSRSRSARGAIYNPSTGEIE